MLKNFFRPAALFFSLQIVLFLVVAFSFHGRKIDDQFLTSHVDKQRRLRNLIGPKLILMGGSNTAFGFDSTRLEKRIGKPAVNMGIMVPLGLDFMLAEVESAVRSGDILVLSPEYDLLLRAPIPPWAYAPIILKRPSSLFFLASVDPRTLHWATLGDDAFAQAQQLISPALDAIFFPWLGKKNPILGVFRRSGFDGRGDMVAHLTANPPPAYVELGRIELSDDRRQKLQRTISLLTRFRDRMAARGASFFLTFPPLPAAVYQKNQNEIDEIEETLKPRFGAALLTTAKDSTFDRASFFDCDYHLKGPARERHTELVAERLTAQVSAIATRK